MVVLRDALADIAGRHSYDRIFLGIVVLASAENVNTELAFPQPLGPATEGAFYKEPKKVRTALAANEVSIRQKALHLFADRLLASVGL